MWLKKLDAKVSHWLTTGDVYVDGRAGHYVRRYILGEQDHRCSVCGIEEWNDQPLAGKGRHFRRERYANGQSY